MCVLLVSLRLQSLQELREVVSIEETDQVLNGRSVRRRASTHENLTSTDLPDVYCYHVRAALRGLHLYNADNTGPAISLIRVVRAACDETWPKNASSATAAPHSRECMNEERSDLTE